MTSLQDGRWISYRYDHGLPHKGIDCIREDAHGKIWVSVREGGVFAFQPDTAPPDTRILESSDNVASHGIASFSFSGWDAWGHTPRRRLVYSWRIRNGLDGKVIQPWSNGSLETVAITPALKPGDYRLEVRAADQDRNIDPTPAEYAFQVQFPIWQQPAYMAPLAGVSLSAIAVCLMWYKSRVRRQRAEFERTHLEQYADNLELAVAERTEEAVESEKRLRLVFENAPACLWHEDFSKIKQKIDSLKKSGVHDFRQYFESHADVVHECAKLINILDVNRAALELHHAESKDDLCDSLTRTFNDNSYRMFQEELIALANDKMTFESDTEVQTLDGEKRFVLLKMFVNPVPANWSSVYVSITDITDRKQAEEESRKHRDELAHVSRISTMGEMATGLAHELNQPLAAIASYSFAANSMIEQANSSPEKLQDILVKLEDQSIRAGEIVRRLRNFIGKNESQRVLSDLNLLIEDVAKFLEVDFRQSGSVLRLENDNSTPNVLVDEVQIQQVLVNLLRNSIDAMQETPTNQKTITISTRTRQDGQAEVTVSDAGKGLTQDEIEQVFEAFFTTKQEGMGLGLAISRSIVEAHAGKFWAKPNSDRGMTFGFSIPLENGHAH